MVRHRMRGITQSRRSWLRVLGHRVYGVRDGATEIGWAVGRVRGRLLLALLLSLRRGGEGRESRRDGRSTSPLLVRGRSLDDGI